MYSPGVTRTVSPENFTEVTAVQITPVGQLGDRISLIVMAFNIHHGLTNIKFPEGFLPFASFFCEEVRISVSKIKYAILPREPERTVVLLPAFSASAL